MLLKIEGFKSYMYYLFINQIGIICPPVSSTLPIFYDDIVHLVYSVYPSLLYTSLQRLLSSAVRMERARISSSGMGG